jgi:hypothetical protein
MKLERQATSQPRPADFGCEGRRSTPVASAERRHGTGKGLDVKWTSQRSYLLLLWWSERFFSFTVADCDDR